VVVVGSERGPDAPPVDTAEAVVQEEALIAPPDERREDERRVDAPAPQRLAREPRKGEPRGRFAARRIVVVQDAARAEEARD